MNTAEQSETCGREFNIRREPSEVSMMRKLKGEYPSWQYPIILWFLFWYCHRHKWKIRRIASWRGEVGVITGRVTLSGMLEFGHFMAGEKMLDKWYRKEGGCK